ncbi:MAG: ClpXP protease specificity-enhancing factor SspB [Alphaproteobacteria bacterium]|nr:ClpXP protease specificity-enhancing factor SspB [Alphaproteobacteria bacterium]
MPVDHIRYDILVQEALRGMVRNVLTEAAKNKGMPGEHHFFITFDTTAEDVRLSPRLLAQYPEEMTVVLQHQFWDLKVTDEFFEVGLSFGGVPERLVVPFEAIKAFADPSVQFTLQFESLAEAPDEESGEAAAKAPKGKRRTPQRLETARTSVPSSPLPATAEAEKSPDQPDDPPRDKGGAEVVRLDRFRKK